MCDRVSGAGVVGMELYDMPMDIDDLAFMSLIACLDESTEALLDRMRDIRELNGRKKAINDEIDRLTRALDASGAESDDDKVIVPGGLGLDAEEGNSGGLGIRSGEARGLDDLGTTPTFTRKQVQDRIESLRRKLEDLGSNSEIALIDLNRLMSKRNEAIQLTSNILASSHQSAMAVIANFKA